MTKVYEQHDAAFRNVSAYIVLRGDKVVAKVAFKFGGAVTAYVHWFGVEMVKGQAGGGGYDRQSAAVAIATRKLHSGMRLDAKAGDADWDFYAAAAKDSGPHWDNALRDAGFTVLQAV